MLPTTSLNQRVPCPSWSWLGWRGPIDLPDLDYSDVLVSQRSEEIETSIVTYVLKNTPLRLVRTSTITPKAYPITGPEQKDDPPASLVTLDMILIELPDMTLARLSRIPDDQLLRQH